MTPFYDACLTGCKRIIQLLLNQPNININTLDSINRTYFDLICYHNHIEIIKLLINDPRFDINIHFNNYITSFHDVCVRGNVDVIHLFLSSNRKFDFQKQTIERYYCYSPGITGFEILKNKNINFNEIKKIKISNNEKLLFSSADGEIETLKELLKNGIKKKLII